MYFLHLIQYCIVLSQTLAKTETRIKDNIFLSKVAKPLHFICKSDEHITQITLHRHKNIRYIELCHCFKDIAPFRQRSVNYTCNAAFAYIIYDISAKLLYTHLCHIRTIGIYRNNGIRLDPTYYSQGITHTFHLLLSTTVRSSRTSGKSSNVYDFPTFGNDLISSG